MRTSSLSIALFLSAVSLAHAENSDWSGLYGGLSAGYLNGHVSVFDLGIPEADGNINGFTAGPVLGFNIQNGNFVFGAETDFDWTTASGHGAAAVIPDYTYDFHWDAHFRARAGFAHNNILFFVAGGLSAANFDVTQTIVNGGTYHGYNFGGGIDVGISSNLVGRLEYIRDVYKDAKTDTSDPDYSADVNNNIIRAALIYKFGQ